MPAMTNTSNKKNNSSSVKNKKPELMIGGQAVIEGVMMRTKDHYSVAVRAKKNKIIVKKEVFKSATKHNKFLALPFVRGMVMLYETMVLGIKVLNYSASIDLGIEEKDKKEFNKGIAFTFVIASLFALALFKFLPLGAAYLVQNSFGVSNFWFNVIDGIAKFTILIGYLGLISLMSDVKRLFQYHGAEHKAVACFERNKPLTVGNVQDCHKEHPRCGTSFIIFVLIISIILYMFIPLGTGFWAKLGLRLLMLPIIAGIAYELIRLAGKYDNWLIRIIVSPGILVQKITTREPDNKQVEVAIASLKEVLK
jgi:uncharacterized protein YqhQ